MKHKLKMGGILALALFLVYLYGYQKEELEIEQSISTKGIPFKVEVPQVESYFVAESSKGKVIDKLFKALGYATRTGGNVTESYETGIGTILTDEILAVQDVFGTKYTFKLDHPEKDFYTFFNLVMVDKVDKTIVQLIKYKMAPEFAALYRSGQKQLDSFHGTTTSYVLSNPCLCEFPNDGVELDVIPGDYTPTSGGGIVSGTTGNPGPGGNTGGSPGGGLEDGPPCEIMIFVIPGDVGGGHIKNIVYRLNTCTGEFEWSYNRFANTKKYNNQTETYNENGCCSFGAIGIMDDNESQNDPCKKLKKRLNDTSFTDKVNELNNASNILPPNTRNEIGVLMKDVNPTNTNYNTQFTQFSSPPNTLQITFNLEPNSKFNGFMHNHFFNFGLNWMIGGIPVTQPQPIQNSINMFSDADIFTLWTMLKNNHVQEYDSFLFIMVYQGKMFQLQITNKNSFIDFGNILFINQQSGEYELGETLAHEYKQDMSNITFANSQNLNRDNFAKMLKKHNVALELYESNVLNPKWRKVQVNNNNTIQLVDCN